MPTVSEAMGKAILHVALVEPEIAPNVGNIARLTAAIGARLHLIGRLGFRLDDRHLRRAGLDYWPAIELERHDDWGTFQAKFAGNRLLAIECGSPRSYTRFAFEPGDCLVFGSESKGLGAGVLADCVANLSVPMPSCRVRSLNLANTVAIVAYEAIRQFGFA